MQTLCVPKSEKGFLEKTSESKKSPVYGDSFRKTINQKGEATLFCVLILVILSGLLTLSAVELQRSFLQLKKRTQLFLCVKETKGELNEYLKFMGRVNWLIKNTTRAQLVAIFIPPLLPYVANADKLKKMAKILQVTTTTKFYARVAQLKSKGCPIDPQMVTGPYVVGNDYGFSRTSEGAAKLRTKEWNYYFLKKPYLLTLKVNASGSEKIHPKIHYQSEEKGAMLSSLLSLPY